MFLESIILIAFLFAIYMCWLAYRKDDYGTTLMAALGALIVLGVAVGTLTK